MKACFLILGHKNLEQIKRLCSTLSNHNVEVFVHMDKKFGGYDVEELHSISTKVHVNPTRISCHLDDWSLIDATLSLIRYAKSVIGEEEAYYILMSGQDYPIKPVKDLLELLNNNYPKPYIDCTPYDKSNWVHHKFNGTFLLHWARYFKSRSPFKLRIIYAFSQLERLLPNRLKVYNKLQKHNVKLYGGSAWWILSKPIIDEILDIVDNKPELISCYKLSNTPEETFFQTFSMMTSLSHLVHVNPVDQVAQSCLTYANFFSPRKGFEGHPHVITHEDYDWLMERPEYIARKFDMNVDETIFDLLDQSFVK